MTAHPTPIREPVDEFATTLAALTATLAEAEQLLTALTVQVHADPPKVRFYTVNEIADMTSLPRSEIQRAIRAGELKAYFAGDKRHAVYVTERALTDWLARVGA